jgi:hypothetical protein
VHIQATENSIARPTEKPKINKQANHYKRNKTVALTIDRFAKF